MRLIFLLPANVISGGIFVVFEHAKRLQGLGHLVTLAFTDNASEKYISLYPGMDEVEIAYLSEITPDRVFDIALATWWETAYLVHKVTAKHYGYFVQGRESYFYPQESFYPLLVQHSYNAEFHVLTISESLSKYLSQWLGYEPNVIPNAVDFETFASSKPAFEPNPGSLRCLVEGVPNSHVKQTELALEVLQHFPEIEVMMLSAQGSPDKKYSISHFFEAVPFSQVPPIYRSCDFILKLSREESFACPVLEMFASGGTAVVTEFAGHEEYIKNDYNALTVPINDKDAAIRAITRLINEPGLLTRLKQQAFATAKKRHWHDSNELLNKELISINEGAVAKYCPLKESWDSFSAATRILQHEPRLKILQDKYEALLACNASLHNRVEAVTNSYSYRLGNTMTKPLRHARKMLNLD